MIAGHIWWCGEFEWQKCVPGVIDDARHTSKNATVKNFTSTDFLGPIRFDSPNGGTFNSLIKKMKSPFMANIIIEFYFRK